MHGKSPGAIADGVPSAEGLNKMRDRFERQGPDPVEHDNFVVHAFGQSLYFVPKDKAQQGNNTRN